MKMEKREKELNREGWAREIKLKVINFKINKNEIQSASVSWGAPGVDSVRGDPQAL